MPDGQGQVSHFNMLGSERVEVLRGPFSALYGNSSGGVIQSWSAPATEAPEFLTQASYGGNAAWTLAERISGKVGVMRSEEHTSELQSLMRSSYAGVCLKKKKI